MPIPMFSLVIFENIPATDTSPSMPGIPVWDAYVMPDVERFYANAEEQFYDPNVVDFIGWDSEVWEYNFYFTETEAFHQEEGKIYWLGVHHTFDLDGDGIVGIVDHLQLMDMSPAAFGWKTADLNSYPPEALGEHFMDDAVWTDVNTMGTDGHVVPGVVAGEAPIWNELFNPFTNQSLDLAFVITPESATMGLLLLGGLALLRRRRFDGAHHGRK